MGRRLMERGPRGIQLTPDGQSLYVQLEPHYQAIEQLLSPQTGSHDDRLTLSALASMANAWLLPKIG